MARPIRGAAALRTPPSATKGPFHAFLQATKRTRSILAAAAQGKVPRQRFIPAIAPNRPCAFQRLPAGPVPPGAVHALEVSPLIRETTPPFSSDPEPSPAPGPIRPGATFGPRARPSIRVTGPLLASVHHVAGSRLTFRPKANELP